MQTYFYQHHLKDQLRQFKEQQIQYDWPDNARAAINLAYDWYDFLPLPAQAFHWDDLKTLLKMPQALFITAEKVQNIPDYNRWPKDQDSKFRVDFFCYMPNGHVWRKHPGGKKSQNAADYDMTLDAGVFDGSFATQHGAGIAMHRCPPAHALARGAPLPIGTALITGPQLLAYSKFDTQHWPWRRFEERLKPLLHVQEVMDITDGGAIPWWLCFAHEGILHGIINEGILRVTARLVNQSVVLTVTTSSPQRRGSVGYDERDVLMVRGAMVVD